MRGKALSAIMAKPLIGIRLQPNKVLPTRYSVWASATTTERALLKVRLRLLGFIRKPRNSITLRLSVMWGIVMKRVAEWRATWKRR